MQTVYNVDPGPGVVGAIASSGAKKVRARVGSGAVRPGQYVIFSGKTCVHPSAAATPQNRGGVVVRDPYKQNNGVYAAGEMVDVLVDGDIWVATENAVTADAPAFVRHVATAPEEKGAFRSDADTSDATHIPGLYYRTAGTGTATSPIKLEVNKSAYVAP